MLTRVTESGDEPDTILTVPRVGWSASVLVKLKLEPQLEPDELEALEGALMESGVIDALAAAIDVARPDEWIARQLRHALDLVRDGDYVLAWPPLVTAVEGLYWEEAMRIGAIDPESLQTTSGASARSANDVFGVLPINDRVRRLLSRYAFGSEANAFRHGRLGAWGERQQCAIWLLALVTWFDAFGWRHLDSADLRS